MVIMVNIAYQMQKLTSKPAKTPLTIWCGCLLFAFGTARGDLVTEWNSEALSAMRTSTVAPLMTRDLAILHVAMYNASESLRNTYNPYSFGSYTGSAPMSGPAGASLEAAMASAANTIMQGLYSGSSGSFTSLYNNQLSAIADSQAKTDGIAWGQTIANDILTWRSTDLASSAAGTPYSPVGTVGYWNQTSPAPALLPGWGNVSTFTVASTAPYVGGLPGGTPAAYVASIQYATDYNQVKDLGSSSSVSRTPDQLTQAYFWSAPDGSVKVPGMWNQLAQNIASSSGLNVSDSARLFAALNVAMADAGIASFAAAYDSEFWRPETAIANGGDAFFDIDGNPNTEGDGGWQPLIASPSYPEYYSTTAAFSGAASSVLAGYFGNSYAFTLGGDIDGNGTNDITRIYSSFSQASTEASMSGVYAGTQFFSSVADGSAMGTQIGEQVTQNFFQNVPEPSGALLMMLGLGWIAGKRRRA